MQIPVYSTLTDRQAARVAHVVRGVLAPSDTSDTSDASDASGT
jgi:hypothetical protein